jgi:hypothetical protein
MGVEVKRLEDAMRRVGVDEAVVAQVSGVEYPKSRNEKQANADFHAAAIAKAEELLGFDRLCDVMCVRSCCKGGYRLENAKRMAREHSTEPLEERLSLLGELKYMGKPFLNADGDIETVAVGAHGVTGMICPCCSFSGRTPSGGPMPLNYCLCCAGHFRVHYSKALGLPLKVKRVVSSMLNSGGNAPCVFVYGIEGA